MTQMQRWVFVGIMVIAATLRILALGRNLPALDGLAIPDDAYLSLEISKNIGQGLGPLYGSEYTNGFQPLYVFLAAPIYAFADATQIQDITFLDDALRRALAIPAFFDLLSCALFGFLLSRRFGWGAPAFAGMILWALHPAMLYTALNGLETSIALFFLLLSVCLYGYTSDRPENRWFPFILGLSLGFGGLARIDHFFLGAIVGVVAAVSCLRGRRTGTQLAFFYGLTGIGFLLVYTPWLVYSWSYTRTLLPVSGEAVRFLALSTIGSEMSSEIRFWIVRFGLLRAWDNSPILVILSLLAPLAVYASRKRRASPDADSAPLVMIVAFGVVLFAAYTLHVLAYWFFDRYLMPLVVIFMVIVVWGIDALLSLIPSKWRQSAIPSICAIAACLCVFQPRFGRLYLAPPDPYGGYRNIGLWARGYFPPGTHVGAPQSGAIAYYRGGFKVLNLDGVVNRDAFERLRTGDLMGYIRDEEIDVVIGWPTNIDFIKNNSAGFREEDLEFRTIAEDVRSWGQPWLVYTVSPTE